MLNNLIQVNNKLLPACKISRFKSVPDKNNGYLKAPFNM